jgi:outer membrane lipoprotein LolB
VRRLLLLTAALWLAGCASVGQRPPVANPQHTWETRQQHLQVLHNWELKGKVGLRGGETSGQANLVWQRDADHHQIRLFGPFGGGMVQLTQDPGRAQLRDSKKKTYNGDNARALLLQTTGWEIPFDSLTYWVIGVPAPGDAGPLVLDPWGRLASLEQSGWRIRIPDYRRVSGYELPRTVELESMPGSTADAPAHHARVKLVLKRWEL